MPRQASPPVPRIRDQAIVWTLAIAGGISLIWASAQVGAPRAQLAGLSHQEAFSSFRSAHLEQGR